MRLTVILVHYQTPQLAARAIEVVRADLDRCGLEGEVLIVDNGNDDAGRRVLAAAPARTVEPGRNLGFAGGVNRGVAEARGDLLMVMNPDVEVLPGCLGVLAGSLADGAEVAGPRFYWDRGKRFLLPPTERRTGFDELRSALAGRGPGWARRARRHWREHARRHWTAGAPLPSYELSGGLLAFRRSAWEANGPFDERYPLYFEETDWLQRARKRDLPAYYLPGAEAVHSVGASTAREPRAAAWFEESAARFRRQRYGRPFAALLERLAAHPRDSSSRPTPHDPAAALDLSSERGQHLWIELAPGRRGFPAAAERLVPATSGAWTLPEEIRARLGGEPLELRLTDGEGRERLARTLVGEG
jgi:GT2 family glycosyltransferase